MINIEDVDTTPTPTPSANTATEKQINFINRLKTERDVPEQLINDQRQLWREGRFTVREASNFIDQLLALPKIKSTPAADVPEGMHRDAHGTIYKVQRAVHGSGNLYAKMLKWVYSCECESTDEHVAQCEKEVTFVYVPGGLRTLSEATRMTLDDARQWGLMYGNCVRCGRTLTDENSIAAGIGPVCAAKWGDDEEAY